MTPYELSLVNSQTFIENYKMEEQDDYTKFIRMVYYSFTTLATIGFGDYRPFADEERIFIAFLFMSGTSIFSYMMGIFIEIVRKF
jgi:hypothetical protein